MSFSHDIYKEYELLNTLKKEATASWARIENKDGQYKGAAYRYENDIAYKWDVHSKKLYSYNEERRDWVVLWNHGDDWDPGLPLPPGQMEDAGTLKEKVPAIANAELHPNKWKTHPSIPALCFMYDRTTDTNLRANTGAPGKVIREDRVTGDILEEVPLDPWDESLGIPDGYKLTGTKLELE